MEVDIDFRAGFIIRIFAKQGVKNPGLKEATLGPHLSFVSRSTLESGAPFTPNVDKRKTMDIPEQ